MRSMIGFFAIGLTLLAACGSESPSASLAEQIAAPAQPVRRSSVVEGRFTLDNGGMLSLADGFTESVARINDALGERLYTLTEKRQECGSRYYVGTGDEVRAQLIDHRGRLCKDLVPAELVVIEELPDGSQRILYSRR